MNHGRFCLAIMLAAFLLGSMTATADHYFISFTGDNEPGPDNVYIMEIDQFGNVIRDPVIAVPFSKLDPDSGETAATAMAPNGAGDFLLWTALADGRIFRTFVDEHSQTGFGTRRLGVNARFNGTDDVAIQATHEGTRFLATETRRSKFRAFGTKRNGLWSGQSFRLSPSTDRGHEQGSVSADGRVAISTIFNAPFAVYVQMLNERGIPTGSPNVIARGVEVRAADITNDLGGRRFVLYVEDEPGSSPDDLTFLQVIDSDNGSKIGQRILVNAPPNRGDDPQSLAIDPRGRFLVLTMDDEALCTGDDRIFFQALDPNGNPAGKLKPLIDCGLVSDDVVGIDIMRTH